MSTTDSFRAFADCLREPAILVSTSGEVIAFNAAAGAVLGVGALAGVRAFRLADFLHTGGAALDDFIRACTRTRQPIFASVALRTATGEAQAYRAEGLLYHPAEGDEGGSVFIRLTPRTTASAPLLALDERLRSFARGHAGSPRLINVNELVTTAAALLRPLVGEGIELTTRLASNAPAVRLDPTRVERVLVNLGVYARDRMPEGGELTLQSTAPDTGSASIVMRDTGVPIAAANLAGIFEPWTTARPDAGAPGISLASSRAAIVELGGQIEVESGETRGATYTVRLPVAQATVATASGRPPDAITVLVVDDDDTARDLIADSLLSAEFKVLSASDGMAAVELVNEYSGPIDVLVTDVVMPRMNGPRVAEILRERLPRLRVLYLSGYTDGVDLPLDPKGKKAAFLAKPFTRGTLLGRVSALLES